jgi:hypothetical protein
MKNRIVPLFLLLPASSAFAESGRVGNGGFAYVCRDAATHAITAARLLDLWEAEGVPTWRKDDSVDSQLAAALARLLDYSPNSWFGVVDRLEELRTSATYTNRALTLTDDAFPPYQPEAGCGYEQVARYETVVSETGKSGLRIANEIFNSPFFSNSDRAALFFHEAAYYVDRYKNEATNSQRTRIVVAHLFSDSEIPNAVRLATSALLVGDKRWVNSEYKEKTRRDFVAVPNPEAARYEIQFSTIDGVNRYDVRAMTAAQRAARYRCESESYVSPGKMAKATTGWVKLDALLQSTPVDPGSPQLVRIHGEFRATEFETPDSNGAFVGNSIFLNCARRDANGKETAVAFQEAIFMFPDGQSLYINDDGSLQVSDGEVPVTDEVGSDPTISSKSPKMGEFTAEFVRAKPVAGK